MNKLSQNFFQVLFPLYPVYAWVLHFATDKPLSVFVNLMIIPLIFSRLNSRSLRIPPYLLFLILFTVYHIASSFYFDTVPPGTNALFYILMDINVSACLLLLLAENTRFEKKFTDGMTNRIYWIVIISALVSLIQIKDPTIFYNTALHTEEAIEAGNDPEIRNSSIYSWVSANSGGITFPFLLAILIYYYDNTKAARTFVVILSGIIVAFLARARYFMISTLVIFSQLFISRLRSFSKLISLFLLLTIGVLGLVFAANEVGYDFNEVINSRILEKDKDMESAKARIKSYEVFMIKFPEHPIFGVGPKTRPDVLDLLGGGIPIIHVGYLSYLYFYGIFGSFLIFMSLFFLTRDAWLTGVRYGFWPAFYGLLTLLLANATFVYFNLSEMGVVLAVIYMRYFNSTYKESLAGSELAR